MAIQLISKEERFFLVVAGSTFYYRRMTVEDYRRIVRENTKRGTTDWNAVGIDVVRHCVVGWDDTIRDLAGNPAPFSPELVAYLPPSIIGELGEEFQANVAGANPVDPTKTSGSLSGQ